MSEAVVPSWADVVYGSGLFHTSFLDDDGSQSGGQWLMSKAVVPS